MDDVVSMDPAELLARRSPGLGAAPGDYITADARCDPWYGSGINKIGELIDTGEQLGLIDKSGTWYSYAGQKLGQGRERAVAAFEESPAMAQQLREALLKQSRAAARRSASSTAAAATAAAA